MLPLFSLVGIRIVESPVCDHLLLVLAFSMRIFDRAYHTDDDSSVFNSTIGYATTGAEDQPPRPPTGVSASGDYTLLPHTQLELGHSMVSAETWLLPYCSTVAQDLLILPVC